jgi:branched-chain amino acid transport system permease protein
VPAFRYFFSSSSVSSYFSDPEAYLEAENWASRPTTKGHGKLIGLVVLFVIIALIPLVVRSPYHLSLLILVGINGILAMTFVLLLRTGLITLAIAAFWGVGAYSSTMLALKLNLSFWLCLPASTIITGVIALGLGLVLVRNPGFSFVIMTMIMGMLFGVIIGSSKFLGGYSGIVGIPPPDTINIPLLPPIEFVSETSFYYLMLFFLLLVFAVFSGFYRSSTGRAWTAIGLNSQLAHSLGINVYGYRVLAFVVAGATAGLIGSFYAHYLQVLRPETFGLFKTVYVHIYAILGGIGFPFLGPIVGSTLMVLFPEFMRMTREVEPIFTGALLVLLILFLPTGILSLPGLRALGAHPVQSAAKRSVAKTGEAIKSSLLPKWGSGKE